MIHVSVLGYGNVGSHLVAAFEASNQIDLIQVYNRHPLKNKAFKANFTTELSALLPVDVCIIAVADDAIADFSKQINLKNTLVVHTSGGMNLKTIKSKTAKGVFYPLQSFTKNKKIDFKNNPICIEAENNRDLETLETLAKQISEKVYHINDAQRQQLHVAAVFVNNFTNHLYQIGESICKSHQLDFDILKPLIAETASKISSLSPAQAQTGPAIRHDKKTIAKHLSLLPDDYQKIYKLLTQSIQNHE